MNTESTTLEGMQADHRQWDRVHSTWRVDIEHWKKEHESAVAELMELQEVVRLHGDALDAHAETIERHQSGLRAHGRAMAEPHLDVHGQLHESLKKAHREHAEKHDGQRSAHERIKKHHHTVMAHLKMLRTALDAAM